MEISKKTSSSDILGALASGLCALHCTLTPLLFAAKPVLESNMEHHEHKHDIWAGFDFIFLGLSLIAVWYTTKHSSLPKLKLLLWSAWGVFALGLLSEPLGFPQGIWLMYAGSIALIVGHVLNYRHCRMCREDESAKPQGND